MGGIGSGQYIRIFAKETVESNKGLDIRKIRRSGLLVPGTCSTWSWSVNGKPTGSASVVVNDWYSLTLRYRYKAGFINPWQDVKEPLSITWTPCNLGGQRPWFECPGVVNGVVCQRRVAILYLGCKYFLCRHCFDLTYQSRNEDIISRDITKAQKIREKMGVSQNLTVPILFKPKHMHQKTFDRLRHELMLVEMRMNFAISDRFGFRL